MAKGDISSYDRQIHFEGSASQDGSGDYEGAWLETGDTLRIRVVGSGVGSNSPQVWVQQSHNQSTILDDTFLTAGGNQFQGEVDLTARYFRLVSENGIASNPIYAVIRAIEVI